MKPKLEWAGHGTDIRPQGKPGTYWTFKVWTGFTPAPYNCRRIAREGFAGKHPANKFIISSPF